MSGKSRRSFASLGQRLSVGPPHKHVVTYSCVCGEKALSRLLLSEPYIRGAGRATSDHEVGEQRARQTIKLAGLGRPENIVGAVVIVERG